ncbi:MAG: hypothetical protein CMH38_06850 [Microbacterium sp.]|jgi:hypothetical protein|uniref:hypothetical protein n=1 Tax=unclassified Microbacterium TaxID=2609290 RepID=UPI0008DB26E0|nr:MULTISPECIES: hypothetical protein [unclassified Microbacterium]MAY49630.1 hypothetical protein [Microbacterium sp.]HBR90197.1 hypothetical protein [Microbacterium sp.]HBS73927.1 hypothetical protein [Microbacterium sp.]|tara:strand:+ start:641 stop:856 length:216 start_codon:yes stop_codon:yes gene_type:complete
MSNLPIPPAPGFYGDGHAQDADHERTEDRERLERDRDAVLDPDVDEDTQNSADADERAAREGVADGDVPNE